MASKLDARQIIMHAYDDANNWIRVGAELVPGGSSEVIIDHSDDSIRIGDGTILFTGTTVGADTGLDVNIINTAVDVIDESLTPEHFNGSVATAGSPIIITPTSANPIKNVFIQCNNTRDPINPNALNDAIEFSLDGGTTYTVLMSGESIFLPGVMNSLKLDTNVNGTFYQVILWS
jgi:hypothetical protein